MTKNATRIFCFIVFISMGTTVFAQLGGRYAYQFLSIDNNALSTALGGDNIATPAHDLGLIYHNPALLDSSYTNDITLNYVNYFSDINFGYVSYARNFKKYGTAAIGLNYLNYGTFTEADETGVIYGTFTVADYDMNLYWAKAIDSNWSGGIALKAFYSDYYIVNSFAMAVDGGLFYHNKKHLFTFGATIKNAGIQLLRFTPENKEKLPFDIQLGISKKVKHAPFRLSLTATNLVHYNLQYNDSIALGIPIDTSQIPLSKWLTYSDNIMRHLIWGVEFLPTKNFFVAIGYNYRRRQELKVMTRRALTGFSFGAGFKISHFYFSYAWAKYHLAGSSNIISVRMNIGDFWKNGKTIQE